MKKVKKGNAGYVSYEKKKRTAVTAVMFAIPLVIFFTGLIQTGTRLNLFTLVAVLGMLPAARSAVGWIMILLQKPADPEAVSQTEKRGPDLVRGYELMVTVYEGRLPLDAMVICGNQVACYSSAQKGDLPMMEKHMEKILTTNGYHGVRVKIFRDLRPYLERVEQLEKDPEKYRAGISFTPDERYPDLSREELIKHTIMAIAV